MLRTEKIEVGKLGGWEARDQQFAMVLKQKSKIDRLIFAGIIGLLVFAPLAFGSVHVWAYTLVELGVFLLLTLWFMDRVVFSREDTLKWVKTPVNWIIIVLFIYLALQLVPLPSFLVAFLSPQSAADKKEIFSILAKSSQGTPGFSQWISMAYFRHPIVIEGLKLLTYLGMFFLVLNTVRSKKRINIIIYVLIAMGLFEVLYGIYQVFSETQKVWWWIHRSRYAGRATGTYIVANHFAGYLELIIPLIFGFKYVHKYFTDDFSLFFGHRSDAGITAFRFAGGHYFSGRGHAGNSLPVFFKGRLSKIWCLGDRFLFAGIFLWPTHWN